MSGKKICDIKSSNSKDNMSAQETANYFRLKKLYRRGKFYMPGNLNKGTLYCL